MGVQEPCMAACFIAKIRGEPACCSPHKKRKRRKQKEKLEMNRFGASFQLGFGSPPHAEHHQAERCGE